MCAFVCVHMCVSVFLCVRLIKMCVHNMFLCVCVYCMYVCMCVCIFVYVNVCVCVCVCVFMCAFD